MINKVTIKDLWALSGAAALKCIKCGRCSASCPAAGEMDFMPHKFTSGEINELLSSETLWKCMSCFCCNERCPKDVKPANLIEAARQIVLRPKNSEGLTPETVQNLLEENMPAQLIVSAYRKYK